MSPDLRAQMLIRTGILGIPLLDEPQASVLRDVLSRRVPGAFVLLEAAVGMQRAWIAETLRRWCDEEEMDLVLTVGGTLPAAGPSLAECVPEATLEVVERLLPGLPEVMRAAARTQSALAAIDRGVAGIRSRSMIVNLPEGDGAITFLSSVADLIPAVVSHLQGRLDAPRPQFAPNQDRDDAAEAEDSGSSRKGLDAGEFAAFLKRRGAPPPG